MLMDLRFPSYLLPLLLSEPSYNLASMVIEHSISLKMSALEEEVMQTFIPASSPPASSSGKLETQKVSAPTKGF